MSSIGGKDYISDPAEPGWPDAPASQPFSMAERARGLAVALRKTENQIGSRAPAGATLLQQARFFLDRARESNLDARLYELWWFIHGIAKERGSGTTKAAAPE